MPVDKTYYDYISQQLSGFEGLTHKKMFGGVGFFRDKVIFGAIMGDVFRLRVDDVNRPDFEERGMEPFMYGHPGKPKRSMPYWSVPEDILADKGQLFEWSERAFEASLRSKK